MMNREIKLRAWDKRLKKMYYLTGFVKYGAGWFGGDTSLKFYELYFGESGILKIDANNCILMMFVGIQDCNNKDIYEGDLVNLTTNHIADLSNDPKWISTTVCKVHFEKGMFKFNDMTMSYGGLARGELKIIGNVFQHDYLLTYK